MGKTMTSADSQGTVILALSKEEAALLIETAQPILEGFRCGIQLIPEVAQLKPWNSSVFWLKG